MTAEELFAGYTNGNLIFFHCKVAEAIQKELELGRIMAEQVIRWLDLRKDLFTEIASLNEIIVKSTAVIEAAKAVRSADVPRAPSWRENSRYCSNCDQTETGKYFSIIHVDTCPWALRLKLEDALAKLEEQKSDKNKY